MQRETHKINASGKAMGRLAVEIAMLLRGKNKTDFAPYKDEGAFVEVENIKEMKITGNKLKDKMYRRHSQRPGGLKEETMQQIIAKHGIADVLRRAVYGMIPKNKLRERMIKRLKIN